MNILRLEIELQHGTARRELQARHEAQIFFNALALKAGLA